MICSDAKRIPKYKDFVENSHGSLALFLTTRILWYAKNQDIEKVQYVAPWLHQAFAEECYERVRSRIESVQANCDDNHLEKFLRDLANKLGSESEIENPEVYKRKVDKDEPLEDYCLRVKRELLCIPGETGSLPQRIFYKIMKHESDPQMVAEVRRMIQPHLDSVTWEQFMNYVRSIDSIVGNRKLVTSLGKSDGASEDKPLRKVDNFSVNNPTAV